MWHLTCSLSAGP